MRTRCFFLAAAVIAELVRSNVASAQAGPTQCGDFINLRDAAQQEAVAVREAAQRKAEREVVCTLVQRFYTAEAAVVKFLEDNKTWCGIPEQAIKNAKAGHEQTAKFRDKACAEAATVKSEPPTLSDIIHSTPSTRTNVPLKQEGGVFVVPVRINDAITLNFTIDSGAADVSVPADVFSTLTRTGTVKSSDIIGEQTYVLADGSKSHSIAFTIRSLQVGNNTVRNVKGSVASSRGALLLGQSFLERFKSWSIDNTRHELLLELR